MPTNINFPKGNGLVPAIVQDYQSGQVLMLGYMNKEAIKKTLKKGFVYFWSRSRKKLWLKGEKSGNLLKIKELFVDCDKDTLLIKIELIGKNTCHTGNKSCFFKSLPPLLSKGGDRRSQ